MTQNNISVVLNFLLDQNNISEALLGRKIGIPRATINRLVSGKTPDPRASTLEAIAEYFDITIDQLLGKHPLNIGSCQINVLNTTSHSIPIINWEDAPNWKLKLSGNFKNLVLDSDMDKGRFAVLFKGESMWPQFQEDTLLIIDPEKKAKNRDFVLVYVTKTQETLFRQLFEDGRYKIGKPINEIFPTIQIENTDIIIGVVVQTRKKL